MFFEDQPLMLGALKYIHLQSAKTVLNNDSILEDIISRTDPREGFVYKPTDREKYL
jgi:hypothetical protein